MSSRIAVVGSINQDAFVYVDAFPKAGETVLARDGATGLGGKGANQAIAAALLGAPVSFVGAVGSDAAGSSALAALSADGVATDTIDARDDAATGAAYITVDAAGENTIIVHSGANAVVTAAGVTAALDRVDAPALVLAQGELPAVAVDAAAAWARGARLRFVLNLAPVIEVAPATLSAADPLVVNEGEAAELLGHASDDPAGELAAQLGTSVVVTLGAAGASVAADGRTWALPSPKPERVVDTTGAGDAFVGALAAALAAGHPLEYAVRVGVAAGSFAVQAGGTTTSYARDTTLAALAGA